MKILIIGASRGTGLLCVRQALDLGHEVTAFARHTDQIQINHPQLQKVQGDFHDQASIAAAVPGHDAVIITAALPTLAYKTNPDFFSRGTRLVIEAMQRAGSRRIVILSNFAAGDGMRLLNPVAQFLVNMMLKEAVADHTLQEQLARDSGLEWSVARPTRLSNAPARGKYDTKIGEKVSRPISRGDVANFLVAAATTDQWLGKTVNLGG
jgi:uncharacterized protein YbjT (DUF2867 family)